MPSFITVDASVPIAGTAFTASCLVNVSSGLTRDVVNIQWLDENGIPYVANDSRITIGNVRQINETWFARDVVIDPLLRNDTSNYACEAAIQGPYITSESISIPVELVVIDGELKFPFDILLLHAYFTCYYSRRQYHSRSYSQCHYCGTTCYTSKLSEIWIRCW